MTELFIERKKREYEVLVAEFEKHRKSSGKVHA